jgi:23S rRNA (adenine2503-C2)-methyltransferase
MGGPKPSMSPPNPVDSLDYLQPSGSRAPHLAQPAAAPGSDAPEPGAPRAVAALRERLRLAGAKPVHEAAVLRAWTHALPLDAGVRPAESFLPGALRAALPALTDDLAALARVHSEHPAGDGSLRLLVALADGHAVESVLLPRDGVCVSTQVGCAVGCTFCMTGREGLRRQLGSAEIVAQVVLARARRPVRKVVFMGMGEPAHNLDAVMEAIDLLADEGAVGHKNLVFSTVGDRRVFDRLPRGRVRPALALSLHSSFADRRAALLPRAPRIDPAELIELAQAYSRATGYPVQYQWTLLEGINDGDDEVERIVALLAGHYAVMNLIPYNRVDGLGYRRPPGNRAVAIARRLCERGVLAKLRQSAGQDVDGGCGQLRARALVAAEAPAEARLR